MLKFGLFLILTLSQAVAQTNSVKSLLLADVDAPLTPVDSPGGGTYSSTQSVTITDATSTFILYTLTGTPPACPATGTLYSGAFNISTTSTLKAIGCNGITGGAVLTSVYTITSITITYVGSNGKNNSAFTSLVAPSSGTYNQAAHNCIVVTVQAFNYSAPANTDVTDIAGDTFTLLQSQFGGNDDGTALLVAYNTAGSAVNTVTFTNTNTYGTIKYWDVNLGVNCTAGKLDVNAFATAGTSPTQSQVITTSNANEAIITDLFYGNASLTTATPPTGFTGEAIIAQYSVAAYQIVSMIQSGVTLSWTSINGSSAPTAMCVISLHP